MVYSQLDFVPKMVFKFNHQEVGPRCNPSYFCIWKWSELTFNPLLTFFIFAYFLFLASRRRHCSQCGWPPFLCTHCQPMLRGSAEVIGCGMRWGDFPKVSHIVSISFEISQTHNFSLHWESNLAWVTAQCFDH